jgi:hypothetical protein
MTDSETTPENEIPLGKAQLPDTEAFQLARTAAEAPPDEIDTERATVFKGLVTADDDIVGLVAYSIYKQHENDWLMAFRKLKERDPSDAESRSFIIGEGTPRRLATYRHLAEATLAGRGPQVSVGAPAYTARSYAGTARSTSNGERPSGRAPLPPALTYIGLAIVFVVAILLAAHYGLPGVSGPARP